MATVQEALVDLILADSGISDVIGSRLYPGVVPESADFPAIAYSRIDTDRTLNHDGPNNLPMGMLQFDLITTSYAQTAALANTLRGVLDGYRGTVTGVKIDMIAIERDGEGFGRVGGSFEAQQDYMIQYHEA